MLATIFTDVPGHRRHEGLTMTMAETVPSTKNDWLTLAGRLRPKTELFINGHYVEAEHNRRFGVDSPIDGRHLVDVAHAQPADVERAVAAARACFDRGDWARISPRERKMVLLRWADLLQLHRHELAALETLDSGKTINDTAFGDLPAVEYCLRWFAEAIDKIHGAVINADPDFFGTVTHEPLGVVAAIVPWNYPLLMAAWKFAPALAMGNSVILKPSEKSPLTALRIAEFAAMAGVPSGAFNVLTGFGDVGAVLSRHHDVDCIAFTGSGGVGRHIMHAAADSNLKRVYMELGGKSPNIVLADCADIDVAASAAAGAIFSNAGQICSAGSRVLVHRDRYDEFVNALLRAAPHYTPSHPFDPDSSVGAIIDGSQLERVLSYIAAGRQQCELLYGGERCEPVANGFYVQPTIFACASGTSRIAREEVFGPVLTVMTFASDDEALTMANGSEYGLAAAVWTADIGKAHHFARGLRAGSVWVNCYDELSDMNFPFGGYKQSGNGRDNSLHALEKYAEIKSTVMRLRR